MADPQTPAASKLLVVATGATGPHWMERLLRLRGFTVIAVKTPEALVNEVENVAPDLVVVDTDLAGGVMDICRRLATLMGPITPIFVTTDMPFTREQRLALLDSGAWECITPPIETAELLLRIDTYVRAKRECDRIQQASLTDRATGLYNRLGLARRAKEVGTEAVRRHTPVASVVFAFDPSEEGGQETVPGWARVFRDAARTSDILARLGPDEVAILAPDTDEEGAKRLTSRYLDALSHLIGEGGEPLRVRAGYHAVANLGYSPTPPIDIVVQAATAARISSPEVLVERV